MHPIAQELNQAIGQGNPETLAMLSAVGKELFFPKGILSQGAEAKQKAHAFNATIGTAVEGGRPMHLASIAGQIPGIPLDHSLTYAPSYGLPGLRKAWKQALVEKNPSLSGRAVSLPVVTQAITHGLSVVADMWVDPEDVLILPDQIWGNYNLIFGVRRSARVSQYAFFSPAGGFNLEAFEACVAKEGGEGKKIIVLLNFPNNPTGYTPNEAEAAGIAAVLAKAAKGGTRIVAISDDAYFGLFYDEACIRESLFCRLSCAHERILAIKLDAATKEDFVWGLRVGFITYGTKVSGAPEPFYEALEKKTGGAVRGSISNASHLSQTMVLNAMESPAYQREKAEKTAVLAGRARKVREVLSDPKFAEAWEPYPFNSGYFMCLRLKKVEAEALRLHLLDRYGVGVIALGKSDLRVAFSCIEEKDVPRLFDLILAGARDLSKAASA